jgi:hypothetical protein
MKPYLDKTLHKKKKKSWWSGSRCRPRVQRSSPSTEEKKPKNPASWSTKQSRVSKVENGPRKCKK